MPSARSFALPGFSATSHHLSPFLSTSSSSALPPSPRAMSNSTGLPAPPSLSAIISDPAFLSVFGQKCVSAIDEVVRIGAVVGSPFDALVTSTAQALSLYISRNPIPEAPVLDAVFRFARACARREPALSAQLQTALFSSLDAYWCKMAEITWYRAFLRATDLFGIVEETDGADLGMSPLALEAMTRCDAMEKAVRRCAAMVDTKQYDLEFLSSFELVPLPVRESANPIDAHPAAGGLIPSPSAALASLSFDDSSMASDVSTFSLPVTEDDAESPTIVAPAGSRSVRKRTRTAAPPVVARTPSSSSTDSQTLAAVAPTLPRPRAAGKVKVTKVEAPLKSVGVTFEGPCFTCAKLKDAPVCEFEASNPGSCTVCIGRAQQCVWGLLQKPGIGVNRFGEVKYSASILALFDGVRLLVSDQSSRDHHAALQVFASRFPRPSSIRNDILEANISLSASKGQAWSVRLPVVLSSPPSVDLPASIPPTPPSASSSSAPLVVPIPSVDSPAPLPMAPPLDPAAAATIDGLRSEYGRAAAQLREAAATMLRCSCLETSMTGEPFGHTSYGTTHRLGYQDLIPPADLRPLTFLGLEELDGLRREVSGPKRRRTGK
ncbi:hypothetical protein C8Q80DRAFT_36127 [Daedaleopsis nitida]|nr:hypothetical protein C8Q80DRAFT_370601 [Daedaleopsis nitida]KAI0756492.1 hypothetical protein C8Q80DRAFT_36127 [Daedaleopsis nitida]